MKLSIKIFLGICIPAICITIILSAILIDKSFNMNLELELKLYMQDFKNINNSIEESVNDNIKYDEIIKYVSDYYKKKDIYLAYYQDGNLYYSSSDDIRLVNKDLLKVENNKYNVVIEKCGNNYYAFIALSLADNNNLVYIRDLNYVYNSRVNLIKLCSIIVSLFVLLITFIAYIISKTLTKPLSMIKKEMTKLSSGNYDISLKEGRDEVGLLMHEFNNMSKELEKRNKDLLELIDSKQLFIDNLSHEMNTPLTSILGYSSLLEKNVLKDEQRIKYLQYIQDETKRISEMYKKLLVISYKENSEIEKTNVDIVEMFDEISKELNDKLKQRKITIDISNSFSYIPGDKLLLSLAVSNLVRNAIDASVDNSTIIIKTYEKNSKKYICVIDKGKGIEESQISKIVDPFYRIDKDRSRKNGGAGLGLSIVTRVMQLHNGSLKIESKLGVGSNFILEFND